MLGKFIESVAFSARLWYSLQHFSGLRNLAGTNYLNVLFSVGLMWLIDLISGYYLLFHVSAKSFLAYYLKRRFWELKM